jgi:hypothetical protein
MDTETRFEKSSPCPECKYAIDAATAAFSHARPKPGDVTVCLNCAAILEFADDLTVQRTDTTKLPLDVLEQLAEVQAAVRKMHKQRPQTASK